MNDFEILIGEQDTFETTAETTDSFEITIE